MILVGRVAVEHLILGDETPGAFGEEDLVTKLDRGLHLAALDQIGVGFENRIDLFGVGNLLSLEDATARLTDNAFSQATVVVDFRLQFTDRQLT